MNRWALRHRDALEAGLEPGEHLLAADRVVRTRALRLSRPASRAIGAPHDPAQPTPKPPALPFPVPAGVFVLAVTDRRLTIWKASMGVARPIEIVGAYDIERIAAATATRPLLTNRLVVLLDSGAQLVVRPSASRHLRHLAAAFTEARGA